jgi:hypothetical protein
MPNKPLHACNYIGCTVLTRDTYCPKHQHQRDTQLAYNQSKYDDRRGTMTQRGYGRRHQVARKQLLSSQDGILCKRCLSNNIITIATIYHHKDGNQFNTDDDNKMTLCNDCHEIIHGRKVVFTSNGHI